MFKLLGTLCLTDFEVDYEKDDPLDTLLELDRECTRKNNLVTIKTKNKPEYKYHGYIHMTTKDDLFPIMNAGILEECIRDNLEDLEDYMKKTIDYLRSLKENQNSLIFGSIEKEWIGHERVDNIQQS